MTNGGLVALLAVAIAGSAGAQSSAEYQTLGAIARARAVDGQLNSIIAIDPDRDRAGARRSTSAARRPARRASRC